MITCEMNDFGFDMKPMIKHREHWADQGRRWRDLDRVVMSEDQMIALAERLMDTDYFSSQTLIRPSIPEFTALIEEDGREENTYVCFRRSVMEETDFLEPMQEGLTRTITPVVDAYVYINNKGRMCNLVATIARVEMEYKGRKMTSTAQFLTWYHDDPATLYVIGNDRAYFQEFLRSVKCIYLGVQMLSLERPEVLTAETVREEYSGTVKKKGRYKSVRKTRFVKVIRVTGIAAPRGGHNITCPCWGVAGHWRNYKSGKRVWIGPYRKGRERRNPAAYKPKEYELPKEDE